MIFSIFKPLGISKNDVMRFERRKKAIELIGEEYAFDDPFCRWVKDIKNKKYILYFDEYEFNASVDAYKTFIWKQSFGDVA